MYTPSQTGSYSGHQQAGTPNLMMMTPQTQQRMGLALATPSAFMTPGLTTDTMHLLEQAGELDPDMLAALAEHLEGLK
jgi:hypothetical protein